VGKIYDALEKADKEQIHTIETGRGLAAHFHDLPAKRKVPLDLLNPKIFRANADPNLVTYFKPQSLASEMFKILRGNILFPANKTKPPKSILITSALPGEGKSFVAANLAVSIAQNINEHVLLMDCDVRRPTIHNIFGLGDTIGLTEYLNQKVSLTDVLIKTEINKLTVLPGGSIPQNPAELLSSKEMRVLLEQVTHRYEDRYVIIDSPPPQLTAETSAIARQVDGVVVVVKTGWTPRDLVSELIENIGKEKIIGVVMNWFDLSSSNYYGYGKYSKYYRKQ